MDPAGTEKKRSLLIARESRESKSATVIQGGALRFGVDVCRKVLSAVSN